MAHTTEDQFNIQWDVLSGGAESDLNHSLLVDPLNDLNLNEPAVLSSQGNGFLSESSHIDIDISSDKEQPFMESGRDSITSSNSNSDNQSIVKESVTTKNTTTTSILNNTVKVTEPKKETEQQSTFISYLVESNKKKVRRRFQDFIWLHNVLYSHFPACFVPPLPEKHRLEYVKGDRFSSEFTEKRRISLERFVQRIARHPILGRSDYFVMFLESSEFNDASARALRESQETVIDTISDSLLNAFSKIRKPDPKFVEMKERNDRMEENLDMLQKTLLRTNKRTEDLCHDYEEFTSSVFGLAEVDPTYQPLLNKFGSALDTYSKNLKEINTEDSKWQIEIHDHLAYYHAVKDILKLRDQKQLDFEELSDYLQTTVEEREKTIRGKRGDGGSVTGYITGKLNEVRGADVDKLKRERVLRLDERVRELQDAIDQTHQVSTAFSDQVRKEDVFFNRNKSIEMFHVLGSYTEAKVNYYQNSVNVWRDLVKSLENNSNTDSRLI